LNLERKLERIQSGGLEQGEQTDIGKLVAAGASPCDAATALLRGCLARQDAGGAGALLEKLPEDFPDDAHRDYLWGAYGRSQGDLAEAELRLARALEARPGHDLARAEMAALLEDQGRFGPALREYVKVAMNSGGADTVTLGLARVLQKLGRLDEARAVLMPPAAGPSPSPSAVFEMARIELESGNYEEAERRLRLLQIDDATYRTMFSPTLITLGLRGKSVESRRLYDKVAARVDQRGRSLELRSRLTNNPMDLAAGEELRRLERQRFPMTSKDAFGGESPNEGTRPNPPSAAELYALHCAACHGAAGDGRGPASRHLFPRPRDLRGGRSRLAGTRNGLPTLEDLEKVLARGMPGSSMPKFDTLPQTDRVQLAEEVLRLRREGIREAAAKAALEEGEELDEAEVRRAIEVCTTPAEAVRVPQDWPDPEQAAARGRESYAALGCVKCHGEDGTGAADEWLFDDQGEPSRPRDLVHEPFKGGREAESIYLRIAVGMPGTAHPAAGNVPEEELTDLVQYLRQLAREPQTTLTNFERRDVADVREYLARLNDSLGARSELIRPGAE
jgi:mono/diheme cytochrome c family protein